MLLLLLNTPHGRKRKTKITLYPKYAYYYLFMKIQNKIMVGIEIKR